MLSLELPALVRMLLPAVLCPPPSRNLWSILAVLLTPIALRATPQLSSSVVCRPSSVGLSQESIFLSLKME